MRRLLFCLLFLGFTALAEDAPPFNLTVRGEKTWTIRIGLGASRLLAGEDLSPGQLALTQTLRAEIEGTALGFITLKASFNDQLGPGFQDFLLTVDRSPWTGELGRFVVGAEGEGLGVYNKRVLGARASYSEDGITFSAVVTRLEGVSESRTFRGQQGFREVQFTDADPEEPWRKAPYLRSVEGLAHWPLRAQFVEGLTQVSLRVDGTQALWTFLSEWGLAYLREDLAAELETDLAAGQFVVLRENGDDLALRVAPPAVARARVQEAIEDHNARLGLTGANRRVYPFVEESELEARFLDKLMTFISVLVDDDPYPLPEAQRRRYLALGERDVIEGTVEVLVRRPGETEFRPSTDPALADYAWTLIPADGVLRISFPDEFFVGGAARVTFAYHQEGVAFPLGISLVPGSERVYLNGKPLTRGTAYTVDYQAGILILFTPLGPEDELNVDFERQRGGLGVVTDYERNMFGLVLTAPGWDGLRFALYRAMDFGTPSPTTHTMPNTHSVAALSLAGQIAGWSYRLAVGASENVFPFDDNARIPSPNQILAIATAQAPDGAYVVFAHHNGLTVHKDGTFRGYGTAEGLAGRAAYALLPLTGQLLVGTDAGLTVVRLTESTPFDRVRSWVRITETDGLPGAEVLALARGGGTVYLATEKGLASFAPTEAEDPNRWQKVAPPEGEPRPTALLWADGRLYLGTTEGLYVRVSAGWVPVVEAAGAVHALLARGEDVYVASDEGIRILRGTIGAGWIVADKIVRGLALRDGALWYAAEDGLWREGEAAPTVAGSATAVGVGATAVWAGTEADPSFRLDLWRVTDRTERFTQARTRIDGRDLARFESPAAVDHTRYGMIGNVVLTKTVGDWAWELSAASRLPGYEEIGRPGRSDSHGFGFTARCVGDGPSALELRGRWDVTDLATHPRGRLSGGLDWRWSGPPTAHISLTPTLTGEGPASFSRLEAGWRAGVSAPGAPLAWSITTSGTLRQPDFDATGQLGATLTLRPAPEWTLDASWTRPFRTGRSPGEQTFLATLRWAADLERVSLSATWRETLRHHLTAGTWRDERTLQADARWKAWSVSGVEIAPRISATAKLSPAEQRGDTRIESVLTRSPLVLRLAVSAAQGVRPDTERSDRALGFSVTWEYAGWEGIRPTLRWDRSWTVLSHPRYPDQVTEREEISLRVAWEPVDAPWRSSLSVIWRPVAEELSLTNRLTWPFPAGSLTAETTITAKRDGTEAKTTAQLGMPLDAILIALGAGPAGDAWGLNAELSHLVKAAPGRAPDHALLVGVTLAVRF